MRLKINMEPFGSALSGNLHGLTYKCCRYPSPPVVRMNTGIEDESMHTPVPSDIHKTYEARPVIGSDVGEAPR